MSVIRLLDFSISNAGCQGDVGRALEWIDKGGAPRVVACANPHSLVVAGRDPLFSQALRRADLLLPDGVGVIVAARLLGLPLVERVVGYDFFLNLTRRAAERGGARYFFLGATDATLELMVQRLRREFPDVSVCGSYAPPFGDRFSREENDLIVELINRAAPDVLWVGMTAPRQEKWIQEHRHRLRVPCVAAIGAVFDFYSGIKLRSPPFWQRLGLEWLHRLCREPFRLWERSVVSAPLFLAMILRECVNRRMSPASKRSHRLP